jgi:hypothetical protein
VIIGGFISVLPYSGCKDAGKWVATLGLGFMAEACIQGRERQEQDIRQLHYPQKRR